MIWEYSLGWYDTQEDVLICAGASYSLQRYDPSADQYEDINWAMDDLTPAIFSLTEDGNALVVSDLIGVESPLTLYRQDGIDESIFD